MATRFRLPSTGTPSVSPAGAGGYTHDPGSTTRYVMPRAADGDSSALTNYTVQPDTSDHIAAGDVLVRQFVSEPLAAGIEFPTTATVSANVQCYELNGANNLFCQYWVAVYSEDGTTQRAVLLAKTADDTELGQSTAGARAFAATAMANHGSTYTTQLGDRLVVEISFVGTPNATGGTQGHNGVLRLGSNGAGGDASGDGSTSTTVNPWIEFSPTITLAPTNTDVSATSVALSLATFAATVALAVNVSAGTAALTLTPYAATVNAETSIQAGVAGLTLATYPATVSIASDVDVQAASVPFTLSSYPATVNAETSISAGVAAFTLAGLPASVSADTNVAAGLAALTLASYPAGVNAETSITASVAALTLTTYAAGVDVSGNVDVQAGTVALTLGTYGATVNAATAIAAGVSALTLSAYPATVELTTDVDVAAGVVALALTTYPASLAAPTNVAASVAVLSITMHAATVSTGGVTTRDVIVYASPYSHPTGMPGERLWRLYTAGEGTPLRQWGWVTPTSGLYITAVPVGSYEITAQDRTALATGLASPRFAFEVEP